MGIDTCKFGSMPNASRGGGYIHLYVSSMPVASTVVGYIEEYSDGHTKLEVAMGYRRAFVSTCTPAKSRRRGMEE
ncbi:MAG: hypothetical protein IJC76_10465 [Lachnospiraceae bacterium]|nr:hypothetical protein [Lachnospiraceae bacterium]